MEAFRVELGNGKMEAFRVELGNGTLHLTRNPNVYRRGRVELGNGNRRSLVRKENPSGLESDESD